MTSTERDWITEKKLRHTQFAPVGQLGAWGRRYQCLGVDGCWAEVRLQPHEGGEWIIEIWNTDDSEPEQQGVALPRTFRTMDELYRLLSLL